MLLSTRYILYRGSVEDSSVIEERKEMFEFIFIHFNVYILRQNPPQKPNKNMIANVTDNNLNTTNQVIKKKVIIDVWNWALTVTKTITK